MSKTNGNLKNGRTRRQSPELAGGAGFSFEDAVSASYLASLLAEGPGPGFDNRTVVRVALQQRNFGEPLDDVIVDFRDTSGAPARLSIQVKRALTISSAATNSDFREVIRDCWSTYQKTNFRKGIDRYGVAVGEIAKQKARDLISLCEMARESVTISHFDTRFSEGGNASKSVGAIKDDFVILLKEFAGSAFSNSTLHEFLAHFVLVEFDFLHAGANDPPRITTELRDCLATGQGDRAPLLWTALRQLAGDSAGKSGEFDRARLAKELSPAFRLRGAPSLQGDLSKLTALGHTWLADIQNDVGGTNINRAALIAKLDKSLADSRFVQIKGMPGSGKSVLLRQRVESDIAKGPTLFLKADRLEGKGWISFANAIGLSSAPLENLLAEIGIVGSKMLFIDGIDRVETDHQPIILDVFRHLFQSPLLQDWKIVVSLRDTGIEPLRNWLGDVLSAEAIATVEVDALDDDEAEILAKEKPHLRALLFGVKQVRDIVRRPFFAKILAQSRGTGHANSGFEPQSEVDLIWNWWDRGGYNATGQHALERQRAIIEIGTLRARNLSLPISLGKLSPAIVSQIDQLVTDGILQHAKRGHSVRFSHDIFFEWAFFHVLSGRGEDWLDEIRQCGEPPAVARVVELLAQWEYREEKTWANTLYRSARSRMRSQWTRAWLLGPIASSRFDDGESQFADVVTADSFHFLKKSLVWFQAEKTTPNPKILAAELPQDQRIRVADMLGWPSDLQAWRRLIEFVLSRANDIPVALYPDIVSVFEVWQNMLAATSNPISRAVVDQCATWLREIDQRHSAKVPSEESRWNSLPDYKEFRAALRGLILRSASTIPQHTEELLTRVMGSERIGEGTFKEIIDFSWILASTHPRLLVDLALKHLKDELPDDRVKRQRKEAKEAAAWRARALAKPESERSRKDQMAIDGAFTLIGMSQFSHHDWDHLAIDRDMRNFWPPSPLRQPFHSLFNAAPDLAIELFNEMCNHAVAAWRQLHVHMHDTPGTPLPLEVHFPWGVQHFWGGDREYLWHRGTWAPKAIASGFMALEDWCFNELEAGRSADDLIRQVVQGNQCIAILGVASMLILHSDLLSETALPIVTAQRLWSADHHRMVHDQSSLITNLMGFNPGDTEHINAIKKASARAVRGKQLRWLAPQYIFSQEFGERASAMILAFKDNLPFQFEEDKNNSDVRDALRRQALEYEELAHKENYRATKAADEEGRVEVIHVSPSADKPETLAKIQRATQTLQENNLWSWASQAFEKDNVDDLLKIPQAIELAKKLDDSALFGDTDDAENFGMRRGAVTATAALILRYRSGRTEDELTWAREVLMRAYQAPERRNGYWSPYSEIPWHHAIYISQGLVADLNYGTGDEDTAPLLIVLVSHPLQIVALSALERAATVWAIDPHLSWTALSLALALCHNPPSEETPRRGYNDPIHSAERIEEAVGAALKYYSERKRWVDLPLPPPAWVKVGNTGGEDVAEVDVGEDDYELDDASATNEAWSSPGMYWDSQLAAKILARVPYEEIFASDAREQLLKFITGVLQWTNEMRSPPWAKKGSRDHERTQLFEWNHELGETLGRVSGMLTVEEVKSSFLEPIFALEGEYCWALLAPFVANYINRYIYDAQSVPEGAIEILTLCLERLLAAPSFKRGGYRSGEFSGFDEPQLVKCLMFVSIEHAGKAARFVNGDWSDIQIIIPLVDRFIRAGGWSGRLMGHFLTLCERSKASYPPELFARQIIAVLADDSTFLKGWHGTTIPARIAALVQHFANRETPMAPELGQQLLRILDFLVDMGDRRSAAMQLSEIFREVKMG